MERPHDSYDTVTAAAAGAQGARGGEEADGSHDGLDAADEVTGASPGTARACSELGLASLADNLRTFGIKPPGE